MSKRSKKPKERTPSVQYMTGHPGPTIDADGKTWRLGFNTQNAKGRLEELVRSRVVRDALALKESVGGEAGEKYWEDTRDALAAGHYDTFEVGWFRVVKSSVGSKLFLLALLQKHHPNATEADAYALLTNHTAQTEAAVSVIAPDFFLAVVVQMAKEQGKTINAEAVASELVKAMKAQAQVSASA